MYLDHDPQTKTSTVFLEEDDLKVLEEHGGTFSLEAFGGSGPNSGVMVEHDGAEKAPVALMSLDDADDSAYLIVRLSRDLPLQEAVVAEIPTTQIGSATEAEKELIDKHLQPGSLVVRLARSKHKSDE